MNTPPMTSVQRADNYAKQNGTERLTPRQVRRINKKCDRAAAKRLRGSVHGQALADLKALLSKPARPAAPNPFDPRKPRLHSVRKPVADLGDVASGRVPLPPTGGEQR